MGGASGFGWVIATIVAFGCGGSPAPALPPAQPSPTPITVGATGPKSQQPAADDDDAVTKPDYWVRKLGDTTWQGRALRQLEQLYEDAVTRNNGDTKATEVNALIDRTVQPLVQIYVEHYTTLDIRTRVGIIKLLAEYRDPRTEPALRKALAEFVRNPTTSKDETDVRWAARAAGELKLPGLSWPLLGAFGALKVSTTLGRISYKTVSDALLATLDRAWVEPLILRLEPEIPLPRKDDSLNDDYRDQLFWQISAAQLLGRLGDARAVDPLLRVMLDPAKSDVQVTVLMALIRLGKPSVEAATKLLQGSHTELIAFNMRRIEALTGKRPAGTPYRIPAALVLGAVGRNDGAAPLIAALQTEKDLGLRALFALELGKLPASAASKSAFQRAYTSMKLDTELPGEAGSALETLTETVGNLRDSAWVDWLLQRARQARGHANDVESYRASVLITALKLARPAQLPAVKKAVDKYGGDREMRVYQQTQQLLNSCGERIDCYVTEIQKPDYQDYDGQWWGIKAGYMIGILGNEQTRDKLVDALDQVTNAAVRYVAAQTIDHLTPRGNSGVVAKLDAIITKNANSQDWDRATSDAIVRQVMYRIGARD
jgi:HEAT repeat protein